MTTTLAATTPTAAVPPAPTSLLSASSQAAVAATAAVVAAHADQITARFYPRMFAEHPELLRVFNEGNQATGEQSRALAASVVAYAVQLIDPDAPSFQHVLTRIAYKHVSLGIRPEQYTIVGNHLLAAVGEVLGDAATPEIGAAWSEVYWLFAIQLIAEEARMYAAAGVDPAAPTRPYAVVKRIQETADVVSLVLEPADDQAPPEIQPGQYVSVFADLPDGGRQPRQYTVSSTATATRLQITVRKVRGTGGAPDGRVSSYLHDVVQVGDLLEVSAPAGDLVVPSSDSPLLLATAGAGITTVLPIVEHIARTQPQRTVIIAHADRTARDHALRETVLHAGRQIDDFTAHTWYETVEPDDTASHHGLMDLTDVPLPDDVQVFTCGPLPFMREVRSGLLARGVPATSIRYEVFGPDLWAAQHPGVPPRPALPTMCEHCGCLSLPELAELTMEHDLALGHIRSARAALGAGDSGAVQHACRQLIALLALHTAVEEHALFPAMAREHPEHIAVLLAEHRVIDEALAAVGRGAEHVDLRSALDLLSEHIKKEQDGVFPAALSTLTHEDRERVRAERGRVGPGTAAA